MEKKYDINQFPGKEIRCSCGRVHSTEVKEICIEENAVLKLGQIVRRLGHTHVYLVADNNTYEAAGKKAEEVLSKEGIAYNTLVIPENEPVPDEKTLGMIVIGYPEGADLILAVGSGTLNDLCKFAGTRMGIESAVLATAPSMDGFTSSGAALIVDHVKTTLPVKVPVAVIGDTAILAKAPMKLITAGLGDTLGKYTCLMDWKIGRLVNGEYFCQEIHDMVMESVGTVLSCMDRIGSRDQEAVKSVMEALVLTGMAMRFAGNSRPASGCEHHMSHYWEMTCLMEGRFPPYHGTMVGVGMIAALKLYRKLAEETVDFDSALKVERDPAEWEKQMKTLYGEAAEGIIALEKTAKKNDIGERNRRIRSMKEHWEEICEMIRTHLPDPEKMEMLFGKLGAPVQPEEMGISRKLAYQAVLAAKEVRDRYTLLQILWDLDLEKTYAEELFGE